jgi:hypothetical protein
MARYALSLCLALVAFASTATAQCPNGRCPLPSVAPAVSGPQYAAASGFPTAIHIATGRTLIEVAPGRYIFPEDYAFILRQGLPPLPRDTK